MITHNIKIFYTRYNILKTQNKPIVLFISLLDSFIYPGGVLLCIIMKRNISDIFFLTLVVC